MPAECFVCTCMYCLRLRTCAGSVQDRRAARAALKAEVARQRRERVLCQDYRDARAEALLCEHLTPYQRRMLREWDCIPVTGSLGGRYWITRGEVSNIFPHRPRPSDTRVWCVAPTREMPVADVLLAQMLLVRTDEAAFLVVANLSWCA